MSTEYTPCKYCGQLRGLLGTKMCDGCWEIAHRVRNESPDLLARIVCAEMDRTNLYTLQYLLDHPWKISIP